MIFRSSKPRIAPPEKRRIRFRSTQLLARRQRLRHCFGIALAAFIGAGSLFAAFE